MVGVLEGVPPSTELGVVLQCPIKVWESAVLAGLSLHCHQFGVHGSQDVDRALIHVPLRA